MKSFFLSCVVITALSCAAGFVTWKVVGLPDRSVSCDPSLLEEHFVCLSTVRSWPAESILWVDARSREEWEGNGVEGSILMNDQEIWDDFVAGFLNATLLGDKRKVVVYCNQTGCGASNYVAKKLRENHADGMEIWVLDNGFKAFIAEAEEK